MGSGLRCGAAVGDRLWVGLACGAVRVFSTGPNPRLLAHWQAHDSATINLVQVTPWWMADCLSVPDRPTSLEGGCVHDQEVALAMPITVLQTFTFVFSPRDQGSRGADRWPCSLHPIPLTAHGDSVPIAGRGQGLQPGRKRRREGLERRHSQPR